MSPMIEDAQKWVDWAFGSFSAQNWNDASYNLGKFDQIYNSYPAQTQEENDRMERLNARAYTLRSMLAERQTWTLGNSWLAPFTPGDTAAGITAAGQEAQRAAIIAQQSAQAINNARLANQAAAQRRESAANTALGLTQAPNAYMDFLNRSIFGVPVWAVGLGALGLGLLLLRKK